MSSEEVQASNWLTDYLEKRRRRSKERRQRDEQLRRAQQRAERLERAEKLKREYEAHERRVQQHKEREREWQRHSREREEKEHARRDELVKKAQAIIASDEYKNLFSQWESIKDSRDPEVEELLERVGMYEAYLIEYDEAPISKGDPEGDLTQIDYGILGTGQTGDFAFPLALWYYRDKFQAFRATYSDAQMTAALEFTKGDVAAAYRMLTQ